MTNPTSEQIERLPKWAQDYIRKLLREQIAATKLVGQLLADQSQKPDEHPLVYTESIVPMNGRNQHVRRYFRPDWNVTFECNNVRLCVSLIAKKGIELTFSNANRCSYAALVPMAANSVTIIPLSE